MASKLCLRIKAFDLNNKMSPELIKPISECIRFLPKTNKRLITTLSSNKTVTDYDKNLIHSKNLLQPRTTSQLKYNKVRSNFGFEDGSNRFLKTLSSLLSPESSNGSKIKNSNNNSPTESNDKLSENEETFEEHEQTIYKGILSAQIKLVKSFSLMTSAIGLSCQPILLYQLQNSGTGSLGVAVAGGAFLSFFTFATPLLIHYVSKKYVTELLYNKIEDRYTAITYSLLLQKKKVNFKLSDVTVPDMPAMFTTITVGAEKQIPLFVEGVNGFTDPQHYVKLMGYDKPLNLRWDKEADTSAGVVEARRKRAARRNRNNHKDE